MALFRYQFYCWACEYPRHGIPNLADLERAGWKRIANARDYPDSWLMGKNGNGQPALFDIPKDWEIKWKGMPGFAQADLEPFQSVKVHFANREDRNRFATLMGQTITEKTRSLWFPKAEIGRMTDKAFEADEKIHPRYPIYVISKGRWEKRLTVKSLEKIGVKYRVVIEPQEYDQYAAVIPKENLLTLPFSNLGQGSIPARNWVWDHSLENGDARHWILDDNIDGFYYLFNNIKTPVNCGTSSGRQKTSPTDTRTSPRAGSTTSCLPRARAGRSSR